MRFYWFFPLLCQIWQHLSKFDSILTGFSRYCMGFGSIWSRLIRLKAFPSAVDPIGQSVAGVRYLNVRCRVVLWPSYGWCNWKIAVGLHTWHLFCSRRCYESILTLFCAAHCPFRVIVLHCLPGTSLFEFGYVSSIYLVFLCGYELILMFVSCIFCLLRGFLLPWPRNCRYKGKLIPVADDFATMVAADLLQCGCVPS